MLQPLPPPGRMSGRAIRRTNLWKPSWLEVQEGRCLVLFWEKTLTDFAISGHTRNPVTDQCASLLHGLIISDGDQTKIPARCQLAMNTKAY